MRGKDDFIFLIHKLFTYRVLAGLEYAVHRKYVPQCGALNYNGSHWPTHLNFGSQLVELLRKD